ncbi:hypothetical protein BDZ94DRAFT_1254036 [Collybia nuda]|uniref:Uncharacterized protein n=1 Tax=Collybia nuda TaxID=64659 RepID=A0A9P5YAR9_9AGAR|nr:hypothetical protein BDZ94DRAFT_1254036 [Collybia nuda]
MPYVINREQTDLVSQEVYNSESEMYIDETVGHAMRRVCGIPSVEKWGDIILKGTNVTQCKLEVDGNCMVRDVIIITRIHSPNSPFSVDVHFDYHYRERYSGYLDNEWIYSLGYRVNDSAPEPCLRDYVDDVAVSRQHRKDGWKPFGSFYLGIRSEEKGMCSIAKPGLQAAHDALFGAKKSGEMGASIGLRETALLILASVGINFNVAQVAGAPDGYSKLGRLELEVNCKKSGICPTKLRKVCGIAPLRGDDIKSNGIAKSPAKKGRRRVVGASSGNEIY